MKKVLNLIMLVTFMTGTTAIASIGDDARAIGDGMKVTMDYTLSVPDKGVAMTTENRTPVSFIQGSEQINPAVQAALYGLKPGDRKQVVLTPEQGFGVRDDTKKTILPKGKFPSEIRQGMILEDSMGHLMTIEEIKDDSVVLDLNHPLAGQNLVLDVHILKVEGTLPVRTKISTLATKM